MAHLRTGFQTARLGLSFLRPFHNGIIQRTSQAAMSTNKFWEADKKAGYKKKIKFITKQNLQEGLSMVWTEMGNFSEEVKYKFRSDPVIGMEPGDYEVLWKFDNKDTMDQWLVTTDRDHNEGGSKAEMVLNRNKTMNFQGVINTEIPKDGVTKRAGYANMRSPKNVKAFQRVEPYDWSDFTHLVMKVRGDGRAYQLLLHMDRYYDIQWNDQYHYTLYTHGGPYWQTAKIPFSKFFLTGKGRVQDKQETIMSQLFKISYMGITLGDNNPGPFQLEIDFIGIMYDATHKETFAYEMYECSPNVHS